jgi:hypothetical protein
MLQIRGISFMKLKLIALFLIIAMQFVFMLSVHKAYAATSPTLVGSTSYSVLGHETVTNTGNTTTTGDVGVNTGSAIVGFPPGVAGGNNAVHLHSNDSSAIAAQADNLTAFGTLDQTCTTTYAGTKDLVGLNLTPGVYCADSFHLTGTLTLSGSGVWIFKSSSDLITSGTANIVGGDPCNVWWRVVSSATLGTNTSLIGNILASTSITMATGATLNGRAFAQTGSVTMDTNTISGPTCGAAASSSSSSSTNSVAPCIAPLITTVPIIIDSKRISPTSIFISWGPYAGINTFNVEYGLTSGSRPYNVSVTGFSTTINGLPANQPIWVQVAATNNCSIGTYGPSMLAGAPSLPNTGFAPHKNNIPLYIPAGIFAVFSVLFILIQKKYSF